MPRAEIPPARIEAARQAFLTGKTLREIAEETGISLRRLAAASKLGGWVEQRSWKQSASALPEVINAVSERVAGLAESYEQQLDLVQDNLGTLIQRLSRELAIEDFTELSPDRKILLIKLAIDAHQKVRRRNTWPGVNSRGIMGGFNPEELERFIRGLRPSASRVQDAATDAATDAAAPADPSNGAAADEGTRESAQAAAATAEAEEEAAAIRFMIQENRRLERELAEVKRELLCRYNIEQIVQREFKRFFSIPLDGDEEEAGEGGDDEIDDHEVNEDGDGIQCDRDTESFGYPHPE